MDLTHGLVKAQFSFTGNTGAAFLPSYKQTNKKRPEMEIQFRSEKWTGEDFYFIIKT